jgi:cytochrome c
MQNSLKIMALVVALHAAHLGAATPGFSQDRKLIARGQDIADANCARCHATGRTGASPLADAPLFRDLNRRYNVELLAEAFAEGIVTGHPGMPVFVFSPADIEAVIAYLKNLSVP